MSVVVLGVASFPVALGTLLGPAIEARFARTLGTMNDTQLELLENHVVVLGCGDLTEPIIEELIDVGATFVVVTDDQTRAQELRVRDVEVLTANPSDEDRSTGWASTTPARPSPRPRTTPNSVGPVPTRSSVPRSSAATSSSSRCWAAATSGASPSD